MLSLFEIKEKNVHNNFTTAGNTFNTAYDKLAIFLDGAGTININNSILNNLEKLTKIASDSAKKALSDATTVIKEDIAFEAFYSIRRFDFISRKISELEHKLAFYILRKYISDKSFSDKSFSDISHLDKSLISICRYFSKTGTILIQAITLLDGDNGVEELQKGIKALEKIQEISLRLTDPFQVDSAVIEANKAANEANEAAKKALKEALKALPYTQTRSFEAIVNRTFAIEQAKKAITTAKTANETAIIIKDLQKERNPNESIEKLLQLINKTISNLLAAAYCVLNNYDPVISKGGVFVPLKTALIEEKKKKKEAAAKLKAKAAAAKLKAKEAAAKLKAKEAAAKLKAKAAAAKLKAKT